MKLASKRERSCFLLPQTELGGKFGALVRIPLVLGIEF
jgi:hypothetical protein